MNKELFYSELSKDLKKKFGTSVEKALPWQLHESLSATVMELIDRCRGQRPLFLQGH